MTERVRNPIIPGNPRERTGSSGILRRAVAEINRRWRGLQVEVLAVFARVPLYQSNEDDKGSETLPAVRYGATAQTLDQTARDLDAALARWIAAGREAEYVAWWDVYQGEAQQLGTAQAVANLTNLSAAYASTRTLQTVVYSAPYRLRADLARNISLEHWTGLKGDARAKLMGIVGRAVVDGKNPKAVRTEIMEALKVSKSRAELYAQTEITGTLRAARWAEDDAAEVELGVRTVELWTSAFLPTTRASHGARHGKTFTREEVKAFYSVNGNKFRCHCAQSAALIDVNDKPILTDQLKRSMAKEQRVWESKQKR